MALTISMTPVYVSDQDRALDFYVGKLGFETRMDDAFGDDFRWLTVGPPDGEASLILASGYGPPDAEARVGTFTGIVITADNIAVTFEELSARGVEFTEEPTMQPWGVMQAQFTDPDGNGFVLTQP